MREKDVTVYISNNCSQCDKLIAQLEEWNITFNTKNVNENHENMEQLQGRGVFGTPATFIDNQLILGFQLNKIKNVLGLVNR